MAIHHHVYHIVHQDQLSERFRPGKEILLQLIPEVLEHALQDIVGTNEGRNVITGSKTDRDFVALLHAVIGALEYGAVYPV